MLFRSDGVCVIAFGAEEEGLLGSRAYARTTDITGARFMLNFDMVAKHTRPSLIGDQALTERAARLAQARGLTVSRLASIGPGASSDHATFQQAGVPVLMMSPGRRVMNCEMYETRKGTLKTMSAVEPF